MFKTRITDLFGIEHPVVGGCMMHISGPAFVAAISNAGALGMMASAMFDSQEAFRQAVREVKSHTDRPFGVNLSLFPALRPIDNELYVEVILDEGVLVVETSGHRPPEDLLVRLKAGGVKTMHKCVSPRHAVSAQKAGVDAVTVFGSEGGGHIGEFGLTTMSLVPRTADALDVPLLAAGGIVEARLTAALDPGDGPEGEDGFLAVGPLPVEALVLVGDREGFEEISRRNRAAVSVDLGHEAPRRARTAVRIWALPSRRGRCFTCWNPISAIRAASSGVDGR